MSVPTPPALFSVTLLATLDVVVEVRDAVDQLRVEHVTVQDLPPDLLVFIVRASMSADELCRALRRFLGARRYLVVEPASQLQLDALRARGAL